MTARISIEKAAIVRTALELISEGGWDAVSARAISARLGCSTMPIYSAIGSMEELRREAFVAAGTAIYAEQRVSRTGNEALDLAVGYVLFARDNPRVFSFFLSNQQDIGASLLAAAKDEGAPGSIATIDSVRFLLESTPSADADDLILRSWIFTNGLAALVAGGTLALDESEIARQLAEAGGAFYLYATTKEKRA